MPEWLIDFKTCLFLTLFNTNVITLLGEWFLRKFLFWVSKVRRNYSVQVSTGLVIQKFSKPSTIPSSSHRDELTALLEKKITVNAAIVNGGLQ